MADGACDAVPVVEDNRIIGIVTRTDLIAALAHAGLKG
jgi:CBS domain-containing membrane protein